MVKKNILGSKNIYSRRYIFIILCSEFISKEIGSISSITICLHGFSLLISYFSEHILFVNTTVIFSDPWLEVKEFILILIIRDFNNSCSSFKMEFLIFSGFMATKSSLSSIVKSDSMIISLVVVTVIMTTKHSLNITHLFKSGIKPSIYRGATRQLVLWSVSVLQIPQIHVLGKRNVHECQAWEGRSVFFLVFLTIFKEPLDLVGVNTTPTWHSITVFNLGIKYPNVEKFFLTIFVVNGMEVVGCSINILRTNLCQTEIIFRIHLSLHITSEILLCVMISK